MNEKLDLADMQVVTPPVNGSTKQSLGCVWIIALVAVLTGWLAGCLGISRTAMSVIDASSGLSPEMRNIISGPLGPFLLFFVPGALAFASVVTVIESILVRYLPRSRRWRWIGVTFAGGVTYWFVVWLFLSPWRDNNIIGFAPLLGSVEGTSFPESLVVTRAAVVGIATGVIAGATLATLQWAILRNHVHRAWWWVVATCLGGAFFLACFLGYTADVLQKGGWN